MMQRKSHRRHPFRRGTVLLEFIACIPLLALVVSATYFFGWAMRNQQRVMVADRYSCWRYFHEVHDYRSEDVSRRNGVSTWSGFLDVIFFDQRTSGVTFTDWPNIPGGPADVRQQWVEEARSQGSDGAGEIADDLEDGHLPWGLRSTLHADFQATYRIWERMGPGAIGSQHARDGRPWRRGEMTPNETILDLYLTGLDDRISSLDLYDEIRHLYMSGW